MGGEEREKKGRADRERKWEGKNMGHMREMEKMVSTMAYFHLL